MSILVSDWGWFKAKKFLPSPINSWKVRIIFTITISLKVPMSNNYFLEKNLFVEQIYTQS